MCCRPRNGYPHREHVASGAEADHMCCFCSSKTPQAVHMRIWRQVPSSTYAYAVNVCRTRLINVVSHERHLHTHSQEPF
jgi:hypothetical protein